MFFAVGLVLLVPVLIPLADRAGIRLSRLGLPLVAALSVSHGLVPPHPGPLAAVTSLHADIGKTILYAILVGMPTALITGLLFSRCNVGPESPIEPLAEKTDEPQRAKGAGPSPPAPLPRRGEGRKRETAVRSPALGWVVFTIVLPIGLMLLGSFAKLTHADNARLRHLLQAAQLLGDPSVAMLIAVVVSFWTLGISIGLGRRQIAVATAVSLGPIAEILLAVAAGGGFSEVLITAGVGEEILHRAAALPISPLVLGWLATAAIRVATGSATVAITAAAGLLAPLVANSGVRPEFMVLAMGAGSVVCSHVNDGGFWLVQKYLRLTTAETLRTWTVLETVISLVALGLTLLLAAVV